MQSKVQALEKAIKKGDWSALDKEIASWAELSVEEKGLALLNFSGAYARAMKKVNDDHSVHLGRLIAYVKAINDKQEEVEKNYSIFNVKDNIKNI